MFLESYFVSFKYYVQDLLFLFGFVGIESWRAFLVLIIIFSFLVYSVCVVWKRGKKKPGARRVESSIVERYSRCFCSLSLRVELSELPPPLRYNEQPHPEAETHSISMLNAFSSANGNVLHCSCPMSISSSSPGTDGSRSPS